MSLQENYYKKEMEHFYKSNMLLILFTLGIATPFVEIRTLHFIMPRLEIDGSFDPDSLTQTESNYRDAFGEDVGDWLDIDLA